MRAGFWWGNVRKRPLGIPRHRWENNIKTDVQEVGCRGMYWIGLALDRNRWWVHVNALMNLRGSRKCGGIYGRAENLVASQEGLCCVW